MINTFIVCWMLLYGANVGQENCTPDLGYDQAQVIMATIVKAGDSYSYVSMRLSPTVPRPTAVPVPPPSPSGMRCAECRKGGGE